jgi:alpha-1,2-mannosyltransferase
VHLDAHRRTPAARTVLLLVAVVMFGLQTLWRRHLTGVDEYDDGVYFGAAMNLVHGVLPYSDYGLIQPPGIAVVLAPFAFAARFVGTAHAFEAARVFVAAVAVLNVWLVGRLLRTRPTPEVVVAMAIMAVYPGAVTSAQTVLIEPVLSLGCLLSLTALFDGDRLTNSGRRQAVAGVLLGLAVATKVWAVAPLLILVAVLWPTRRTSSGFAPLRRLVGGAAGGLLAVCVPLAGAAPRAFLHDVFTVQAIRNTGGYSWPVRLQDLSGTALLVRLLATPGRGQQALDAGLIAAAAVVGVLVAMSWRTSRPVLPLDLVGIGTVLLLGVAFKLGRTYYYHYSGFMAPFLALAAARVVACLTSTDGAVRRRGARGALVALSIALPAIAVADITHLVQSAPSPQVTSEFRDALPARGCVLHLQPALGLLADRFTTTDHGCPAVVDYLGEERILVSGLAQSTRDELNPALQRRMLRWVSSSSAVVVGGMATSWGPEVSAYVSTNFVALPIPGQQVVVYVRVKPSPLGSAVGN